MYEQKHKPQLVIQNTLLTTTPNATATARPAGE